MRWLFHDLIGPGEHGIGTEAFNGEEGYKNMAKRLVELQEQGRHVDEDDYYTRKVLNYYNCFSVRDLKPYTK